MMERLLNNDLAVKIISVILALLLWAVVIHDYNAPENRTLSVALHVIPHPVLAVYEGPPEGLTVEVQISDRKLVVDTIRPEQFQATVDYTQIKEAGKPTTLDVKVTGPKNVSFFVISPKQLTVTLIEQATKLVDARVEPASGIVTEDGREFRYTSHLSVEKVSLSGRKDFLQFVRTARLDIPREQLVPRKRDGLIDLTPVRLPARVVPLSETGDQVANLPTTTAEVEITWEELAQGQAYALKPVVSGSPAPGYEVTGVTIEPANATLRPTALGGKLPVVQHLDLSLVDVSGQSKSFTAPARVILPPGTLVTPESVTVTVSIGEVKVERVFGAMPVKVKGMATPQDGTTVSPTAVEVRLKGPSSVLAGVGPNTVSVSVDATGLTPGPHSLPVQLDGLPVGVDLSINPAVVTVTVPATIPQQ